MKSKVSVLRELEYVIGGMNALATVWADNKTKSVFDEWRDILFNVREEVEDEDAENA